VKVLIAPSILAADFAHLADEIRRVEDGGADLIHVDVMDGHFVPNLTLGIPIVEALHRVTRLPLDVHLMIENPDRHVAAFARAGASVIAVHAEVCPRLDETLARVHDLGLKVSVAINPETPASSLSQVAAQLDAVILMSVHPGFTGQSFIPESVAKIREVRTLLDSHGSNAPIEVDGGVGLSNAAAIVGAGASILVGGAGIFHTPDAAAAVRALRAAAEAA
jgi:ribulose-phosphate 3-epimerase